PSSDLPGPHLAHTWPTPGPHQAAHSVHLHSPEPHTCPRKAVENMPSHTHTDTHTHTHTHTHPFSLTHTLTQGRLIRHLHFAFSADIPGMLWGRAATETSV